MENLSPYDFLEKLIVDQAFREQVAGCLEHTLPINRTQMSRQLAEAGKKMGYEYTTAQIEEGFRRLWLMKSMWSATKIRHRMNRAIRNKHCENQGSNVMPEMKGSAEA